jgi:hypothetical protein
VFRRDGSIARPATASVIGRFLLGNEARECVLATGDVLVIYTDGVTEAENAEARNLAKRV